MAFDGGFLHKIISELNEGAGAHIDKIHQPSRDELVILLRKKGFAKKMLITARQGAARIQFTEKSYENPLSPPMFCMLARKHLAAAKLISVSQPGLERIAELTFSATNELGDIVIIKLIAEFIGSKTNIILVGRDGRIIDSLRRSDPEKNERTVLPGAPYVYPDKQDKLDPLEVESDKICAAVSGKADISKALLGTVNGFSPLVCREVAHRAEVCGSLRDGLGGVLSDLYGSGRPIALFGRDKAPFDFSYTDITQYGDKFEKKEYGSFSELLEKFFSEKDNSDKIRHAAGDIIKLVGNLKARTERKLALRLDDLKKTENREMLRIYGELLKANLYKAQSGATFLEAENYYDNMKPVRIPLDPALSPQKNAAKYFKDYKKTYTAEQTLTALTEKDREELVYFESVLDSIARSETLAEIAEIREELYSAGYIKRPFAQGKKVKAPSGFKEYKSKEGYRILVGKNNRQNDYITTSLATKADMWFHVKNVPGSHVVVFCGSGDVSDETVLQAAGLAAENSKAAGSSNVAVDYTPVKFVKKPGGAKPGMVIYTTNKTVYVTPERGNNS